MLANEEAKQMGGIMPKSEEEALYISKCLSNNKPRATKELHNQGELRSMTTRAPKGRYLKAFATIAGRRTTCLGIVGPRKSMLEGNVATSKKEMEEEWDAEAIFVIEEDKLTLMTMMEEHMDKENDWIIDSRSLNHMIDDQSGATEAG